AAGFGRPPSQFERAPAPMRPAPASAVRSEIVLLSCASTFDAGFVVPSFQLPPPAYEIAEAACAMKALMCALRKPRRAPICALRVPATRQLGLPAVAAPAVLALPPTAPR